MYFDTLKKNYWKGAFIVLLVGVIIGVVLITKGTQAKYQTSQSVPLIRGTINFKPYDFKIMAMYQENESGEYEEVEVMPSSGYVINEEDSYCYTVTQEERDDTAVLYTDDQGQHVVGNLKKSSKCYLWFDKEIPKITVSELIAAHTVTAMPSITEISTDTSNTLYTVADDDGTSYVFRGNPSNNWVNFGGFYWRIIRINGDGSIRMIYNGTSTATNTTGTQISASAYNPGYNDNAYVGFMYGTAGSSTYAAAHANTNNSTIKNQLDSWYTSSGLSSYAEYIDTNAGFCNDRKISTVTRSGYGTLGYGTNGTVYAPTDRVYDSSWSWLTTQTPTLKCNQIGSDLFTVKGATKGNKALTNPVGLITADEVVYAGGFGGAQNTSYYLYTGQNYWTMSPYHFYGSNARVFVVVAGGFLDYWYVHSTYGVRPVINLKADVTLSGDGTAENAYEISS